MLLGKVAAQPLQAAQPPTSLSCCRLLAARRPALARVCLLPALLVLLEADAAPSAPFSRGLAAVRAALQQMANASMAEYPQGDA